MDIRMHNCARGRRGVFATMLVLAATFAACTGDHHVPPVVMQRPNGGDPGNVIPPAPAPKSGQLWGRIGPTDEVDSNVNTICLIVESGELSCVIFEPAFSNISGALHGTFEHPAADVFSGSGKMYASPGQVLADGISTVADFTIVGGELSYPYSDLALRVESLGGELSLALKFDHIYYFSSPENSNWAFGIYPEFEIAGEAASLTIEKPGTLFAQSVSGCTGNGQVVVPDPALNGYEVDVTFANCGAMDGSYSGLATLTDFIWVNSEDRLLVAVFNDDGFIAAEAVKGE